MPLHLALCFQRVDPSKGGAETYVADLARALVRLGHRVDLYAHEWAEGVLPPEVRTIKVPAPGRTKAARIWGFADRAAAALEAAKDEYDCTVGFINTWGTDVLIPQGGTHGGSLECNARRFRPGWRRGLYRLAKRINPKHGLYRAIEAQQYDPTTGARIVVAVGAMVREHLARFHGVPESRVRVIPNAIDASRLAVADPAAVRAEFRAAHGLKPDDLVCLFVAHNARLKGLPDLLAALRLRRDRDPGAQPIHLVACGGGQTASIRRQIEQMGLSSTVHLAGFVPDVRAAFHAADLFCLPTYYDPCSLVVFEALACGLPVITTAYNGAGDVMTPGREGFVIPSPDDHAALADALDRLADDEARRAMSTHAAALGRAQSFDRHVGRLVSVFEEVARLRRDSESPAVRTDDPGSQPDRVSLPFRVPRSNFRVR